MLGSGLLTKEKLVYELQSLNIWRNMHMYSIYLYIWRSIALFSYLGSPKVYPNTPKFLDLSLIVLFLLHIMPNLSANSVVSAFKIYPESGHFFINSIATTVSHLDYSDSFINSVYSRPVLHSIFSSQSDPQNMSDHDMILFKTFQWLLNTNIIMEEVKILVSIFYVLHNLTPAVPVWFCIFQSCPTSIPGPMLKLHSYWPHCCYSNTPVKPLPQGLYPVSITLDSLPKICRWLTPTSSPGVCFNVTIPQAPSSLLCLFFFLILMPSAYYWYL